MSEMINRQKAITSMFHGVLFAYQKGISNMTTKNATFLVDSYMIPYLDKAFRGPFLSTIMKGNAFDTLNSLGDFLTEAGMVKNYHVSRREEGFDFVIDGCSMSDPVHKMLMPKDVVCPLGLVARYLVEKSTGFEVIKELTEFTEHGSRTGIDIGNKVSHLDTAIK